VKASGIADSVELDVGGRTVRLPRPDKLLFPAAGFTKRDLVEWYAAVAPALLPHVRRRPLTVARFPDGVEGPGFYQSQAPPGRPPWLEVARIPTRGGRVLELALADDAAALAWLAANAAIELHPFLWRADRPRAPRALVVDLDPGQPAGFAEAAGAALAARERLGARALTAVPKTSGSKGLHLLVPLDGAQSFEESKAFARALARELTEERPDAFTDRMALAARGETLRFGPAEALRRLERDGDPFAVVQEQRLPAYR
jgi:bifunctional non-homologous end joining protein LigD